MNTGIELRTENRPILRSLVAGGRGKRPHAPARGARGRRKAARDRRVAARGWSSGGRISGVGSPEVSETDYGGGEKQKTTYIGLLRTESY